MLTGVDANMLSCPSTFLHRWRNISHSQALGALLWIKILQTSSTTLSLDLRGVRSWVDSATGWCMPMLFPFSNMLQAAGGGIAASAGRQGSALLLDAGNGLIVAGIAFQVFTMSICGLLILDFAIRFWRSKPGHASDTLTPEKTAYQMDLGDAKKMTSLKTFCCAIVIAYLTVLIRCIYRVSLLGYQ